MPKNHIIHHIDNNKLNNHHNNLQLMTRDEHASLHHTNKKASKETRKKLSKSKIGKSNPMYGKIGENHPMYGKTRESHPVYKNYARIVKNGYKNKKQNYVIKKDGKTLKQSINKKKLKKWFKEEYPNEKLIDETS